MTSLQGEQLIAAANGLSAIAKIPLKLPHASDFPKILPHNVGENKELCGFLRKRLRMLGSCDNVHHGRVLDDKVDAQQP